MPQRTYILIIAFIIDSVLWFSLGYILFFSPNSYGDNTMSSNQLTNDEVIEAWKRGQQGKSKGKQLQTDGRKLFSYSLCIGDTFGGDKIAVNYTASVGHFASQTTSQHVGLAKRSADQVMHPEVYEITDALRDF